MLIACEKCATTYVLDERLIPAAGAPVQCTRCGHVFTARPGAAAPAAAAATADTPQPRSTMVFGKSGDKPTHQTMMFGAGAAPAAEPAAAANRTMMFGAKGPAAPAPAVPGNNRTMIFGAEPAAAPAAPANNRTMAFGSPVADPARPAPKSSTMMFGAPVAPAAVPPNSPANRTMVFGAVEGPPAAPAPAATRPTSQTMVFGAAAPAQQAPAPASSANRTMMFGVPTAEQPNVDPPAALPGRTSLSHDHSEPGKLTDRTVRIAPDELERMMREHNARGAEMTPPEGAPAGASQKTQMFAMSDIRPPEASTPSDGSEPVAAVQARHDRTAMFAMSAEPAPPPAGERVNVRFDPSLLETLPPGDSQPGLPRSTMIFGTALGAGARPGPLMPAELTTNPDLVGTTMPNLPELPRELNRQPEPLEALASEDPGPAVEEPAYALANQARRRNRLALIIVAVAIAGAAGAVGWKLFGAKLLAKSVPIEAMQRVERGMAELRKDDSASKASAAKELAAVVKAQPAFVDAHAALVTALTLQLDDLQQRARRLDKAAEERNARIVRYGKEKTPGDWENRAGALVAEVGEIKKAYDPLVASARELEGRLREAYRAMQVAVSQGGELSRQAELALIRAQALYHAYGGTEEALKLTRRYQTKSDGKSDGWIDLVDAEYAANTRASPELIATAQKQLTELYERDPTFFRTYVLKARLFLQARLYDEAEAELQTVSALWPQHDVANELSEWVKKARAEQAAKEKERAPPPQ